MAGDIPETSSGLLVDAAGRILMGLRAGWKRVGANQWDGIGGRLEPGETMDEALVREIGEELGVEPTHFTWLASIPEPQAELYGEAIHHIYAVYAWRGGEPWNACDEHTEIRWFTPTEIAALRDTTDLDFPELVRLALSGRPAAEEQGA